MATVQKLAKALAYYLSELPFCQPMPPAEAMAATPTASEGVSGRGQRVAANEGGHVSCTEHLLSYGAKVA